MLRRAKYQYLKTYQPSAIKSNMPSQPLLARRAVYRFSERALIIAISMESEGAKSPIERIVKLRFL